MLSTAIKMKGGKKGEDEDVPGWFEYILPPNHFIPLAHIRIL
jgi:hypothetical protein